MLFYSAAMRHPFPLALLLLLAGPGTMEPQSPSGIVFSVAGNGYGWSPDGGLATQSALLNVTAVAFDPAGNLYFAEDAEFAGSTPLGRIRKVGADGVITTVAGGGTGYASDDPVKATSVAMFSPIGLTFDTAGNLYIADYVADRVRKVTPDGIMTRFAGNGRGSSGDGGPATQATFYYAACIAFDASGNLYICDMRNNRIRKVNAAGAISNFAGDGFKGSLDSGRYAGDGGPAVNASLYSPWSIAVSSGNVYIADTYNYRVRKVGPDGIITTVAGNGKYGFSGDGGPAAQASLMPTGLTIDSQGTLYILDDSCRIRTVSAAGVINTVAGTGTKGFGGDGGPPLGASFHSTSTTGLALDRAGALYIPDYRNGRIRVMTKALGGIQNAASNSITPLSPGQIVVLYGTGLGPADLTTLRLSETGRVDTELGGTSVLFNGIRAPMIYTSAKQVSAVVPYGVSGANVQVAVRYRGGIAGASAPVLAATAPGIFTANATGAGQAAAFNQDGWLNTPERPARSGEIVVFYATGEGQTTPPGADGAPAAAPYPKPVADIRVRIGGQDAEVIYAAAAPGLVAGVMQVNARVPEGTAAGAIPVLVTAGKVQSQAGVTVAVGNPAFEENRR
jgi:uncharacterized protein (TIGR03437 family)